jgi:hypothetical protein
MAYPAVQGRYMQSQAFTAGKTDTSFISSPKERSDCAKEGLSQFTV